MESLSIAECFALAPQLGGISDSPRLDIELLLGHVLQKSRTYLFTWPEETLSRAQLEQFNAFFLRRLSGEPVAHIIGSREFWSLPLAVNASTLIPRPDTELLVECVLELFAADSPQQRRRCLDLGTGTGAIVLAIASEKKYWELLGVDNAENAVLLAEQNRVALGFHHVAIRRSDWFAQIPVELFDVIVSNPPYIDPQDPHLNYGDVRFEPRSALVAERHGLTDIEQIVTQSGNYLAEQGWILLEHGYNQASPVRDILASCGFKHISTRCDYAGNERVTIGQKPGELIPVADEEGR